MCSCFSSTVVENEVTISFVGLDGAGKTTIVNRLAGQPVNTVSPTCGLNNISFVKGKFSVSVLDLGGEVRIRDIWKNYYHESHAFVFVIDISNLENLDESQKLLSFVSNDSKNKGKPFLIFFNKQDKITNKEDVEQLKQKLKIDELTEQTHCTFETVITCAVRGKNLKSYDKSLKLGFDTLLKQLSLDFEKVNKKVLEDTEVHDAEMKEKIKLRNERVQQKIAERERLEAETKNETTTEDKVEAEEQQETTFIKPPEVLKVENTPRTSFENNRSEVVVNSSVLEEALREAAECESVESDGSKEGEKENVDADKLESNQTPDGINMNEVCAVVDKMGADGQQELFEKRCKSEFYFERSTTFDEFLHELKSGKRVGLAKLLLQYCDEIGQEKNFGVEINSLMTNNKLASGDYAIGKADNNSLSDLTELSSNDELVPESASEVVRENPQKESPPVPVPQPRSSVEAKSNRTSEGSLPEIFPIPVPKTRQSTNKKPVHVSQSFDSENEAAVSTEKKSSDAKVLNTTSIFNIVNMTSTVKTKKRKHKKRRLAERLLSSKLSARSDKVEKILDNGSELCDNSEQITAATKLSGVGDQILDEPNVVFGDQILDEPDIIPGTVPENVNDTSSLINGEKSEKGSEISFSEEHRGEPAETERKKSKKKKKNKVKPIMSELPPLKHNSNQAIILPPLGGVNKAFVNNESDHSSLAIG